MDLRQLICFVTAYDTKSISKSAPLLFVSQQAVSYNIKSLEKHLGGMLFSRTPNGIIPTDFAEHLIDDARKIIHANRAFTERAHRLTQPQSPQIRFGYANGIFTSRDAIHRLNSKVRDITDMNVSFIERNSGECVQMLQDGQLDVILLYNPPQYSDCTQLPIKSYPLCVGMRPSHPLSEKEALTIPEIEACRVIGDPTDDMLNSVMTSFEGLQQPTNVYYPSGQLSSYPQIMEYDESLLIFSRPFIESFGGEGVVVRPYPNKDATLDLCVVHQKKHPMKSTLTEIVPLLKAHFTQAE